MNETFRVKLWQVNQNDFLIIFAFTKTLEIWAVR